MNPAERVGVSTCHALPEHKVGCEFGVWIDSDPDKILEEVWRQRLKNRKGDFTCFFLPYQSGMLMPAAKVLQEREERYRREKGERRLTKITIWVAIAALVANVLLQGLIHWPDIRARFTPGTTATEGEVLK